LRSWKSRLEAIRNFMKTKPLQFAFAVEIKVTKTYKQWLLDHYLNNCEAKVNVIIYFNV
jgi:hypothetical protein